MTGEPLTVWVVGHIAKMWFMKQGRPDNQASITVIPLSQALAQQSATLFAKLSKPPTSKWNYDAIKRNMTNGIVAIESHEIRDIRAVKWQSTKVGGESNEVGESQANTMNRTNTPEASSVRRGL